MLPQTFLNDIQEMNEFADLLLDIVKEWGAIQFFEKSHKLRHRLYESISRLERLLQIANNKKVEVIALIEYYVDNLSLTTYFGNRCYTSSLFAGNEQEAADRMLHFIQVIYNVLIVLRQKGDQSLNSKTKALLKELKTESKNNLKYLYNKSVEFYKKIYEGNEEKLALMCTKMYITEHQKQRNVDSKEFLTEAWVDAMLDLLHG